MAMRSVLIAASLAALLSSCLGNDPTVGTGPIALSPQAQQNYQRYLKARSPGFFVVTEDGQDSIYNYCSSGRCYRTSANEVIYECEQLAEDRDCKVYASKGRVVWKTAAEAAAN
ncbi:MAG: hypothetical protein ACR2QJ_09195 [Geminicoccaceae bacterium]